MISLEDGIMAVKAARAAADAETSGMEPNVQIPAGFEKMKTGVFVSINEAKSGLLRGCIGYPQPPFDLARSLVLSARGVCYDERFPPLKNSQVPKVVFEVTFLTEPELIEYETTAELMSKIEIGKDGLIMEYGRGNKGLCRNALYLPQVPVEENWTAEEYLSNICMKAGMQNDAWKSCALTFKKFQGITFAEKEPNGEIVRK
ncbi:MAG: TIGR00296 family protein [archaeon]|nr:TIGR00296 family protein [archaeon]